MNVEIKVEKGNKLETNVETKLKSIMKNISNNNFAIISAGQISMNREEMEEKTNKLINEITENIKITNNESPTFIKLEGHYKHNDGRITTEKSIMFFASKIEKTFLKKLAEKYNQEAYIHNMILYNKGVENGILNFTKATIRETKSFEEENEENYSTYADFPELSFKFE